MPQIYDIGPTTLLPLRRKACWGFFALKIRRLRPGLNPQTWVLKASTLPLDHRSRMVPISTTCFDIQKIRVFGCRMIDYMGLRRSQKKILIIFLNSSDLLISHCVCREVETESPIMLSRTLRKTLDFKFLILSLYESSPLCLVIQKGEGF